MLSEGLGPLHELTGRITDLKSAKNSWVKTGSVRAPDHVHTCMHVHEQNVHLLQL